MANIIAYLPFDMSDLDFSRITTGAYQQALIQEFNLEVGDIVYRDAYRIDWYEGGFHTSLFLGPFLSADSYGELSGGVVTAYVELVSDGAELFPAWELTEVMLSASDIVSVINSSATFDDEILIEDVLSGNDIFVLSPGDDRAYGQFGNDTMYGAAGNDTLIGNSGADYIYGEQGDDLIYGGFGNDGIGGQGGDDRLFGNGGDDVLALDAGNDLMNGGGGSDAIAVYGGTGARIHLGLTTAQSTGYGQDTILEIENVVGGRGDDWVTGNGAENLLIGRGGNDTLRGASGSDTLWGDAGADLLKGGSGRDALYGGGGADKLVGGTGRDRLYAGTDAARDEFVFRSIRDSGPGSGRDQIRQFDSGEDVINLRAIDARAGVTGNQRFSFSDDGPAPYSVWVSDTGQDLILRADVDGDSRADFSVLIANTASIDADDLLL